MQVFLSGSATGKTADGMAGRTGLCCSVARGWVFAMAMRTGLAVRLHMGGFCDSHHAGRRSW